MFQCFIVLGLSKTQGPWFWNPGFASTVKWTAPNPYLVFNEGDSKLYTNFVVREEKNHRHFKNILIYKLSQANYDDQKNLKESLHILEDNASGVQVVILNK
jgi:hypothetical protein